MIEKTGLFYMGKEFSMDENKTNNCLHYDSRDLTTHAVCIGMTGSGKTGLCIDLLEEATLNGIPSIIIDPKGDMTNLLLAFPDLLPEDFIPWINDDDARRDGVGVATYAGKIARIWKEGLSAWGIGSDRIRKYRESAEFKIYTPGSKAGYRVSILSSLHAPKLIWAEEEEILREKIRGTVSALLGLIDYNTDPIRSKEHILLSNIFEHFWRKGEDLTLETLIGAIGNPPFEKLGVLSLETFFPKNERRKLLLDLNSIIAAPSFENWIEGEPLNIGDFLHNSKGVPQVSIFYTAHLSDNEKIFFTSLLLEEMLTWVRSQPGTNDLKSILYIDEVFGYIPPYPRNPPTKRPLLLLYKQARAFGTGVVLTTQNPVDIDYKVLTNAGTWFIGKLQTEQDKGRLLDGLEMVTGERGEIFDRRYLDHLISSLKKRVFIHHNVHNEKPEVFKTRWAMSYLRGPLTKEQIQQFAITSAAIITPKIKREKKSRDVVKIPPRTSDKFTQFFLPRKHSETYVLKKYELSNTKITHQESVYSPFLFARCHLVIDKARPSVSLSEDKHFICDADVFRKFFVWKQVDFSLDDISASPDAAPGLGYQLVNKRLEKEEGFKAAKNKLLIEVMRTGGFVIHYCPDLKIYSEVGETLDVFEERCADEFENREEIAIDEVRKKYEKKIDRIQNRIERKEVDREGHKMDASARKREEYLSGAETVLSWVIGRRSMRGLSTASRKRRMRRMAEERIKKADEIIKDFKEDLKQLKQELEEEIDALEDKFDDALEEIRPIEIKVKKKDITIHSFGLLWIPVLKVVISGTERYFNTYTGNEIG